MWPGVTFDCGAFAGLVNSDRRPERKRPILLFVVNADWFFLSHRLPIAERALQLGFNVAVAASDSGMGEEIQRHGMHFYPLPLRRNSCNPIRELRCIVRLLIIFLALRPELVHHVTIKPVLYGSLVSRFLRQGAVVNAISGLGFTFTARLRARVVRGLISPLYRFALRHPRSRVIVQNPEDLQFLIAGRFARRKQLVLIRGSGVDCREFSPAPMPDGPPIVMLISRMLWDKGVGEFVEAANTLGIPDGGVRFVLVGSPDPDNPSSVPQQMIDEWVEQGIVESWGWRDDVAAILKEASVVVLPSYREGLPKVLLEAAATARPIVATDVPGCREIVQDGVNGFLVPARDSGALAEAIRELLQSFTLRDKFGRNGRKLVESGFSVDRIVEQTVEVYGDLIGNQWLAKPEEERQ